MSALLGFIRLLRPVNLLIIALTMYLIRYLVIGSVLETNDLYLVLSHFEFAMLTLSTVLLAAAGNIINDYFDMRVDRINKPDKVILGRLVKRRWAMLIHFIFNFVAVGIGFWLALRVDIWELFTIHIFAATSLWFYSVVFKRQFLIGNVVIAILAALVPLMIAMFEMPIIVDSHKAYVIEIYRMYRPDANPQEYFNVMYLILIAYAAFAFITTLVREIQKDMADYDGDKAVGCNTVPISLGIKNTKIAISVLIVLIIAALVVIQQWYLADIPNSFAYFAIFVIFPMLISWYVMIKAQTRKQHITAGRFMKIAMLGGICFSIVIWYYLTH